MSSLAKVGPPELARAAVSVVVPSNRPERLGFALEALAHQTVEAPFEVVVVLNGPAGALPAVADELGVRFIEGPRDSNVAGRRNVGWRASSAPLVAFTDDDCRPAPEWLEALLAARPGDDEILQGRTEPDPDEEHLLHGLARSQRIEGVSPWSQTCNIAYPRPLLERLDGFDERFPFFGEDTDLALRAAAAGASIRYVEPALVRHAVIPKSLPTALREAAGRDFLPRLVRRHPPLRGALPMRVFWKRSHATLPLAFAGSALARRTRGASLLLTIPYLDDAGAFTPPLSARRAARVTVAIASTALVDAVEIGATVRAAIAARTFVI